MSNSFNTPLACGSSDIENAVVLAEGKDDDEKEKEEAVEVGDV